MGNQKSRCVVGLADPQTQKGRDPFAPPGVSGNRWIKLGCDGEIPSKYRAHIEKAVRLAYALNNKKDFVQNFDKIVKTVATGKTRSYLDALDAIILNLADTSTDPIVKKEMKDATDARKQDPTYQIEGGFTIGMTGRVYIREFALKSWNEMQLAGLISHEAAHAAGAPSDMFTELILATLDQHGYRRRP